jgi:hypothetical protein
MRPGDDGPWSGTTRGDRAFAIKVLAIGSILCFVGSFAPLPF